MKPTLARHLAIIKENTVEVISEQELVAKLENSFRKKRPLKLKIGFDPTASDIHLGHTVLLGKLRRLQELGHQVYFIIGDFTAKIGDPSQRVTSRPLLTEHQIKANAATYIQQAFKILKQRKTTVIYNSIWYKKMKLSKFLKLLSLYTVARTLERDDFSQRMQKKQPLTLLEIIYPLIQGYDSCKIEADIEFGGTDQKFNLIVGRRLQEAFGQPPQVIITMPILVGLDGKNKMSKSLKNYISITEDANSMVGKLMSISDELMWEYARLLYKGDVQELKKMHPKEAKMTLACQIASFYHSAQAARKAKIEFEKVFSQKKIPKKLLLYRTNKSKIDLVEVLYQINLLSSKNEARRLLSQGGISLLDPNNLREPTTVKNQIIDIPSQGVVVKVGKKKFFKITCNL